MQSKSIYKLFILAVIICTAMSASAQHDSTQTKQINSNLPIDTVEASCRECQFKLPGKGCHLAIRIKGKVYFVDGTSIDAHGDAHAQDGFCKAIHKATTQGTLVDNRYKLTYFQLLDVRKN